ncbi:hypothetical protein AVEN_236329-1 [Araneus ventricosus]|uniref:Uncharacterized protein n=1 Tax=Araneus ventricosus TaxID=182803 RepID=A0A4Y2VRJ2_ARAVE|nr:hypothetical protein AVEN_236329-1 [Araneus ventricosus]
MAQNEEGGQSNLKSNDPGSQSFDPYEIVLRSEIRLLIFEGIQPFWKQRILGAGKGRCAVQAHKWKVHWAQVKGGVQCRPINGKCIGTLHEQPIKNE